MNKKIGFIGCGKMASAIIGGVIASNYLPKENIMAAEISEEKASEKSKELGIKVITDNNELVNSVDVVFVATTPNFVEGVLNGIKSSVTKDKLVVSIAAGVTTRFIESILGSDKRVVRVMPNTPALVLEGMSGVAGGTIATEEDVQAVVELLSNIGKAIEVTEEQLDIVTAISGSGPAFYYKVINDIARAGEKMGMDYEKALTLSIQTAIGSAKMLLSSDKSAEDLIASVATKGGCTRVGVDYMEEVDTADMFYNLIEKTAEKAHALGK
ncbi:TPA: pyrroline-5-carboxylate reductase [Candidatus Gastranaerophilales bacterium HUM_9]|nr:MAG TPA: pyrroline-5-carboxylate reductase [Candidatus Gastranaerophilales bacterium HUM_9]HBX35299.1 pyrroline-5-carboxylate reductase [Cyanobacteria bacterium UBA11440]